MVQSHSQDLRADRTPAACALNPSLQAFPPQTFQETECHCSSEKLKVLACGQVLGTLRRSGGGLAFDVKSSLPSSFQPKEQRE